MNDDDLPDDPEFMQSLFFLDVMFLAGLAIGAAAMYFFYCSDQPRLQDADPGRYKNYADQSNEDQDHG